MDAFWAILKYPNNRTDELYYCNTDMYDILFSFLYLKYKAFIPCGNYDLLMNINIFAEVADESAWQLSYSTHKLILNVNIQ